MSQFPANYNNGGNKLHFDEMMMMSALYWTNTLGWIFIMLAHWKENSIFRYGATVDLS
jgi:hypothetical protein